MTTPKEALELNPCPFCGATPHRGSGKIYHDQLHGEPHQDFSIWCPKGHAKVTGVNAALAADEWNTRTLASIQGEDAVERVATTIRQWTSHSYMQLHAGEMTAQERRTVTAVVEAIGRQVSAILATGLVPDEAAIRAEPTDAQINSACLSFRHDYGLLDDHDRERLRFVAVEWLRAWQKEGFGADRDEIIERCAAVVDQCNREGPYQAIGAATKIRALKSATIRSGGGE